MENRNLRQLEYIIETVQEVWNLNLAEEDILTLVLEVVKESDSNKITLLQLALDGNWDKLLRRIPSNYVADFASDELGMVSSTDKDELVSSLEDLDFDFFSVLDEEELLSKVDALGYTVEECQNLDMSTSMGLEEVKDLFLNASFIDREKILNSLK